MRKKSLKIGISIFVVMMLGITSLTISATDIKSQGGIGDLVEFVRPDSIGDILNDFEYEEITTVASEALDDENYPAYNGEDYLETLKTDIPVEFEDIYKNSANPPDWADGFFVGVWGVNNESYLGYFAGYYHNRGNKKGFYAGVWNTTDNQHTGLIFGFFRPIYTLGRINITDGPRLPIIGFLLLNDTHLAGRIMSLAGPPVWMYGIHQELSEKNKNINTKTINKDKQNLVSPINCLLKHLIKINYAFLETIISKIIQFRSKIIKNHY